MNTRQLLGILCLIISSLAGIWVYSQRDVAYAAVQQGGTTALTVVATPLMAAAYALYGCWLLLGFTIQCLLVKMNTRQLIGLIGVIISSITGIWVYFHRDGVYAAVQQGGTIALTAVATSLIAAAFPLYGCWLLLGFVIKFLPVKMNTRHLLGILCLIISAITGIWVYFHRDEANAAAQQGATIALMVVATPIIVASWALYGCWLLLGFIIKCLPLKMVKSCCTKRTLNVLLIIGAIVGVIFAILVVAVYLNM